MRSRYTAYVKHDSDYLERTWHPDTRPANLALNSEPAPRWTGLKILRTSAGLAGDSTGIVEFEARYKLNGRARRLHEVSRFVCAGGCWLYLDGDADQ
jgi:SEC-C motif-containing protein